jgi:hypothetical protein
VVAGVNHLGPDVGTARVDALAESRVVADQAGDVEGDRTVVRGQVARHVRIDRATMLPVKLQSVRDRVGAGDSG